MMFSPASKRKLEFRLLLLGSLIYITLLWLAYEGQTKHFVEEENRIVSDGQDKADQLLLNLNNVENDGQVRDHMTGLELTEDRTFAARKIFQYLQNHKISSIKDLLKIRFTEGELRQLNFSSNSEFGKKNAIQDSTQFLQSDSLGFVPIDNLNAKNKSFNTKKNVIEEVGTFSIYGRVVLQSKSRNGQGEALAGFPVVLYHTQKDSVLTDAEGKFEFRNLSSQEVYKVGPSLFSNCLKNTRMPCAFELEGLPERFALIQAGNKKDVEVNFVGKRLVVIDRNMLLKMSDNWIVRTPQDYRRNLFIWGICLYLLVIYVVHVLWRLGFKPQKNFPFISLKNEPSAVDPFLLPIFHLLTGMGIALMVSLRDPLRQELLFADFASGVLMGILGLWLLSLVRFQKIFAPFSKKILSLQQSNLFRLWTPAMVALLLFVLLAVAGHGPGGTKVNLWIFQPSEFIKLGIVFFLAGYFSLRWEELRVHRTDVGWLKKLPTLKTWIDHHAYRYEMPRGQHVLPVLLVMAVFVLMFYFMKDMGPAMIIMFTFLVLYAIARKKYVALLFGVFFYGFGLYVIYWMPTTFKTFYTRIAMMLSPWDNFELGGEHLAQGFWALSSGGWFGMGLGLGAPEVVPAAHTDMVLPALGEELGFLGLMAVISLFILLFLRGIKIAREGIVQGTYAYFLALGITLLMTIEILLILSGVLGFLPLSGVVTPFISSGKSSMIVNGIILGILAGISGETYLIQKEVPERNIYSQPVWLQFASGQRFLTWGILVFWALLGFRLLWIQGIKSDEWLVKPALVKMEGDFRRFKQNPRIALLLEKFPRGTIRDQNGVPLAVSDCQILRDYAQTDSTMLNPNWGVDLDQDCLAPNGRIYPFKEHTFFLLGDYNTRVKAGYPAAQYLEYDLETSAYLSGLTLSKGFRTVEMILNNKSDSIKVQRERYDYRELVPLLRAQDRYPYYGKAGELATRKRDLTLTTDIRLQIEAGRILEAHTPKGKKSALVVIDVTTGGVLANVSYPLPKDVFTHFYRADSTVTMDLSTHGQYAPGSTFKMVTAIAAMRKTKSVKPVLEQTFICKRLPDGRVGNFITGYGRPIRDASGDAAHGNIGIKEGLIVSCNAYFAQLGTYFVKPNALLQTMNYFTGIRLCDPTGKNACDDLNDSDRRRILAYSIPQVSFGQGSLLASPLGIAQVAAAIANSGKTTRPYWILAEDRPAFEEVLSSASNKIIAEAMRGVVQQENGTAYKTFKGFSIGVAGKTGTAENSKPGTHAWFAGFAPYSGAHKIAFAVVVENGGGGAKVAAPIARELIEKAKELGLF
ncbi:MAG TPA: FtsW/RodA/SpoVE family cell cycle protein [Rhodothermales bacterium]|nr:FtsW/RodA/SpoVE family cell cycle protein [Rhodothermales bacterium]